MRVKFNIIVYSFLILFTIVFSAQADQTSKVPTRIVLTWEEDPATSQSVTWRTDSPVDNPIAQIAPLSPWARKFKENATAVSAFTQEITTEEGALYYHHTARFKDLASSKQYVYRVGDGEIWSEWNVFHTASSDTSEFSFLYLGDIQNDIYNAASPLLRKAYAHDPDMRFVLIAGDLVNRGRNDDNWQEFFDAFSYIPRSIPLVPAPGNHDAAREEKADNGVRKVDPLYLAHFALPMNGPDLDGLKEAAFYMDYQNARFVVFNSNSYSNREQIQWLETVLKTNTKPWLIVTHHHPIYSTGNDRDNKELREILVPLYEKYNVDLVLQGHDHHYGRTAKIVQDKIVANDANAPVYVVSVSGPKMYGHNDNFDHLMRSEIGETQLYQIVTIKYGSLSFETWSLDGRMVDGFTLKKSGESTVLIENERLDNN